MCFMPQDPDSYVPMNKPDLSVSLSVITHTIPSCLACHTPESEGEDGMQHPCCGIFQLVGHSSLLQTGTGLSPVCLQSHTLICCHFKQILQGSANTVNNILLQRLFHVLCHCCSVTPSATWQAADSSCEHLIAHANSQGNYTEELVKLLSCFNSSI